MVKFQFSDDIYNMALFAFHFSGKADDQQNRPEPVHRTLSSSSDRSVLSRDQTSDPACTLNNPNAPHPALEHLINDGL